MLLNAIILDASLTFPTSPSGTLSSEYTWFKAKPKKKAKASLLGLNSVTNFPNVLPIANGDLQTSNPFIPAVPVEALLDTISGADAEGEVWTEEDIVSAFRYVFLWYCEPELTSLERDSPANNLDKASGEDAVDEEIGEDIDDSDTAEGAGNRPSKRAWVCKSLT